jgi:hypothetical protein
MEAEQIEVKLDLTEIDKKLDAKLAPIVKKLEGLGEKKEAGGKGVIEARLGDNATKLLEQLRNVATADIKEQWTIVIPAYLTKQVAAHLRDFVRVVEDIKGKPGDTVNIPYVKDLDFAIISVGGSLSETTGLVGSTTTAIKEAGAWTDIEYWELENFDQNLLDELNAVFVRAAVRAEDKQILDTILALTGTNFAGDIGRKSSAAAFYASNIAKGIGALLQAGKEVVPGECLLSIGAEAYQSLLDELTASQVVAYARSDVIQRGLVQEYLGVKLVVHGSSHSQQRTNAASGTCELAFLMRPKYAVVLAPKRDILIETDRIVADRELRIVATHTFAYKVLDQKSIVRIWCNTFDNTS